MLKWIEVKLNYASFQSTHDEGDTHASNQDPKKIASRLASLMMS
jgi:hypothetical protein